MESTCPHMGAPLSHAPLTVDPPVQAGFSPSSTGSDDSRDESTDEQEMIDKTLDLSLAPELATDMEDLTEGRTITCPWHHYDFDLVTGESPVGIKACVYDVKVKKGEVWVEVPEKGCSEGGWEVVELKGVSEEFADPPVRVKQACSTTSITAINATTASTTTLPDLPRTLVQSAILILNTPNPSQKIELTRQANRALRQGDFQSIRPTKKDLDLARRTFDKGRYEAEGLRGFTPPREGLKEVDPRAGMKRGKGGNEKSRVLMIRQLHDVGIPSRFAMLCFG